MTPKVGDCAYWGTRQRWLVKLRILTDRTKMSLDSHWASPWATVISSCTAGADGVIGQQPGGGEVCDLTRILSCMGSGQVETVTGATSFMRTGRIQ